MNTETPIPPTEPAKEWIRPPAGHFLVTRLAPPEKSDGGIVIPGTVDPTKIVHDTGHSRDVKDALERFEVLEVHDGHEWCGAILILPRDVLYAFRQQVREIGRSDLYGGKEIGILAIRDAWLHDATHPVMP